MSQWSRRDLLKRAGAASAAAAGAAVALNPGGALAATTARGQQSTDEPALDAAEAAAVSADGPLMVCIRDAQGGDVSILHGTEEVVVRDRRLVAKIVRAKKSGANKA
jgi:hypothetical protein